MQIHPGKRQRGFTLIELLVVIAIIAILIGLLVPAVQKVREAAARASCQNNLKQLALAVHSYHDTRKYFPSNGATNSVGSCCSPASLPNWSWIARILPNLEQNNIYRLGNMDTAVLIGNPAISATIPILFCPSDEASGNPTSTNRSDLGGHVVGLTNYQGVSGCNWAWGTWVNQSIPDYNGSFSGNGLDSGNGIFWRTDIRRKLRLTDVRDGTSNTFMIGEDIPSLNNWCSWPYDNNAVATCAIPPNTAVNPAYPPSAGYTPGAWHMVYSFRSWHTGGLQFAYADASVHFISDTIPLATYWAMATYRGGEVVVSPDF